MEEQEEDERDTHSQHPITPLNHIYLGILPSSAPLLPACVGEELYCYQQPHLILAPT